jgi:chloramphenicol O-acetyltransferase type A
LHFLNYDFPYSVIGFDVEIKASLDFWKTHGYSPYIGMVYAVCHTANHVPAFKQRIHNNLPVQHGTVHANYTVPHTQNAFGVKEALYTENFKDFHHQCQKASAEEQLKKGTDHHDAVVYMSAGPWLRFTHVVQPTTRESGSIPRIVWGKFFEQQGSVYAGLSVQTHHSLVDGVHVGDFYTFIQNMLHTPQEFFI